MNKARIDTGIKHRIGIDVGGTKIAGVVMDPDGQQIAQLRRKTPLDEGYDAVIDAVATLYRELAELTGGASHTLGIGTPGSISPASGLLRNCNATLLNGRALQQDLAERLDRPFTIANDANCFALAEAQLGACQAYEDILGIVLGTGVGAGLILQGRLVAGRNGIAGEWGHMVLDPSGPPCYCGRKGCVERFLSGTALEASYLQWTRAYLDAPRIVQQARAGDKLCAMLLDQFLSYFAEALASIVAVLDPAAVVIGGGLASVDELYTTGVERLRKVVFCDHYQTPVLRNRMGNTAGVFGAALIGC